MIWLVLTLISAFFIGIYEVAKKHAVQDNAVWLVLLYSSLTGGLFFLPVILISKFGVFQ